MSDFDFGEAKEAIRRLTGYMKGAKTVEDFALRMMGDTASPFHRFDSLAHAAALERPVAGLMEAALSALEGDEGGGHDA